ncbi:outer membrane lipoprotein-sorting protein [Halarchaeum rubridurum]|uniref:Outer membrane lipoprotein-sorting protein n=1 Tax=Halarchaeum rubridurum TaxID=489911 RepID=A0A830FXK8_9EURY|nr:outer membrane lipoprotein-sorting protein [Halarchaeum rubridurum]MBP1954404.1 outer membrane lipoprotein-sorting protein [Halarchaeum rubridurum]GGM60731.1 hypothetical protein GCM10009017_08610 [Halarchaeum rubridurum]
MPRSTKRCALALGLVGALLLAGCSTLPTGGLDADAVGDQVQHRYNTIEEYSATVTKTVETTDGTSTLRAHVSADTDGATTVTYRSGPDAGTTVRYETATRAPVLSTGRHDAATRDATYGALAASLVRTSDVSLDGTAILDGHRTAVVSLAPARENAGADANATTEGSAGVERRVWVDTERRIPLRVETTWTAADGTSVTETVSYENVTLHETGDATDATARNTVSAT